MAVTFNISTGNPVVFTRPSLVVTFTDTTPAICGVSAWDWSINNTTVNNASSWTHTFFSPQEPVVILTVSTSSVADVASEQVTFVIEEPWPTYPAFRILPSNNFSFDPGVGAATLTAQNISPANMTGTQFVSSLTYLSGLVLGTPQITGFSISTYNETVIAPATAYAWYFNNVPVSTSRDWTYQFFDPMVGTIYTDMTSMAFGGTAYETNSTDFSSIPSIWQTLSSVPASTHVPAVCTLPTQLVSISAEPAFPNCANHEPVTPAGIRGSTTLNHVVTSYELLAERIKMKMGWPNVNIEICDDVIFDNINEGCEWFSKYAGFTEEYLVFDSRIYECGVGLRLDAILNNITDFYCKNSANRTTAISGQYVDCDLNNYRKVVGVFSVDPAGGQGGSTEVLFNMDYLFAQQAYFGQMMGGMGYDVTTWHLLKSWLDLRKKMFATQVYVNFNPRSQILRLAPEPELRNGGYIGIIGCRMERSIADLVQERWVQRYALALTKISLAHIRGKFGAVTLFGGAQVNPSDLMTQGLEEKKALEEELMNGYGEAEPPLFFIE